MDMNKDMDTNMDMDVDIHACTKKGSGLRRSVHYYTKMFSKKSTRKFGIPFMHYRGIQTSLFGIPKNSAELVPILTEIWNYESIKFRCGHLT